MGAEGAMNASHRETMRLRRFVFAPSLGALLVAGGIATLAQGGQQPPAAAPQPSAAPSPSASPQPSAPAAQPAGPRAPASSLARPTSPAKEPDAAGFIRRWLVLEPIRVPPQLTEGPVQALVKKPHFPDQLTVLPAAGEKVTVENDTLAWHGVDTLNYNLNLFHFAYALGKPTSNVLFWAVTVVDAPRDMPGLRLAIGSNAASVWWLNGEEVIGLYNDRQSVIDDGVSARVTLKKGPNVIRAAIVNAGGATDFCARFIDEEGRPVKGYTTRLTAESAAR
jgi:hypothetical protein